MPAKPAVDPKPSLACVGTISSITPAKVSGSGNYAIMKVSIEPVAGAGRKTSFNFLFLPQYFMPGYKASFADRGEEFVYNSNISSQERLPAREAFLYGRGESKEESTVFDAEVFGLPEHTVESVGEFLQKKFEAYALEGGLFGYILKQKGDKTGEVNEKGYAVKILTPYMELGEFFPLTPAGRRKIASKLGYAQKQLNEGKTTEQMFVETFDLDEYLPKS